MNKLFLIDGAAGTGKTDLLNFVKQQNNYDINIVSKLSTRPPRAYEQEGQTDLQCISKDEFFRIVQCETHYYYHYGDPKKNQEHLYALSKADLRNSLQQHEFTFAIVRSRPAIDRIIRELSPLGLVKRIFIHTDENKTISRMKKEHYSEADIEFRIGRNKEMWDEEDYFDPERITIINNSEPKTYHMQVQRLLEYFSVEKESKSIIHINGNTSYALVPSLIGKKREILEQLNRYPFEKNIFLMMKFRPNNRSLYEEIKRIVEENGFRCVRADDPNWTFVSEETDNYLATLYCCKYGIALFDKPEPGADISPNVAYELGIMHYQHKKCLILKNNEVNGMPFDLVSKLFHSYTDGTEIRKILESWLKQIKREG